MKGVNGQPGNWNFFADDFNTIIPAASGAALLAVATKFWTETEYIQEAALSNLANADQSGNKVQNVITPYELKFKPHPDVASLFPVQLPGSDPMVYLSQLESVKEGSNLFNVYALDNPTEAGGVETLIGTLQLEN